MICKYCGNDFKEKDIQESHDVPTYLWEGNRKGRKNQADKHGRHWLCKNCHEEYENGLRLLLRIQAKNFADNCFKKESENG